ncbi:MAG: helix-turn-helix transcriptional regulator [Theionarchaea archaeon]|nr:MAG: hypothetical protein AYK18_03565 [Theionarchaea archaeon DG-70]MBU7010415.1 helix-turn-helix transcriptional regulator [Theionarchaea archaeon]
MNLDEILHVFRTDEEKAKLLAMQIANDRGREVLEYLYKGRAKSASEVAQKLDIPLPTVMFHLERFLEIGIIKVVKTRMSKKLREIKYYGPAKQAILIIPYQKEETISYIKDAVKSSVVTPLTVALAVVVAGAAGFLVRRVTRTSVQTEALMAPAETEGLPLEITKQAAAGQIESFFSLQNPVILVVLGCILTLVIFGIYSYVKGKNL